MENHQIAAELDETARLLAEQGAPAPRVRRLEEGAAAIARLEEDAERVLRTDGREALAGAVDLPPDVAAAADEIVHLGCLVLRRRLAGLSDAADLFCLIPGVGRTIANRAVRNLGLSKLEELAVAAHDGRLGRLSGVAGSRAEAIRTYLVETLPHTTRRAAYLRAIGGQSVDRGRGGPSRVTLGAIGELVKWRCDERPDRIWVHAEVDGWDVSARCVHTREQGGVRDHVVVYAARDGEEDECILRPRRTAMVSAFSRPLEYRRNLSVPAGPRAARGE